MSGDVLVVVAMIVAVAGVAVVGLLLVRGAERPDYVSNEWRTSHVRDRRDDG